MARILTGWRRMRSERNDVRKMSSQASVFSRPNSNVYSMTKNAAVLVVTNTRMKPGEVVGKQQRF